MDTLRNLNKAHALTIEKLENRIITLESSQSEEKSLAHTFELERAALNRKVTSLENQLRFQTNLNDETKREIEKLDGEIAQVAESCSNREQILQKKLEETQD